MPIEVKIEDATIQKLTDDAVLRAVKNAVESSSSIKVAIDRAMSGMKIPTEQIEKALEQSIKNVTSKPDFLDDLVREAILKSAHKLGGAFEASLRAAGKRMALDPDTLEKLVAGMSANLVVEAHNRMNELEKIGGGQFA